MSQKLYLILELYFETAKLLMSEILVFPASLYGYNSFDTLYAATKLFSKVGFPQNWNSIVRYSPNMLLSWMFWNYVGLDFCALCHITFLTVS